jgi:hypothetical protein
MIFIQGESQTISNSIDLSLFKGDRLLKRLVGMNGDHPAPHNQTSTPLPVNFNFSAQDFKLAADQ